MRPKPGFTCSATVPFRQQAWRRRSSSPRPRQPIDHSSRPGRLLASRLSSPAVSTSTALPDQTVPRASASSTRSSVAWATARASQAAGAKAISATMAPTTRPQIAQRRPALREASQACSA